MQKRSERALRIRGTAALAAHLGVSRWTVSRVLNGHAGIREETRQRVLQAVEELGFEPNRLARSLRGLPSGLVGVSFPFLEATILAEKSRVLQDLLKKAGYRGIFEIPMGDPEMEAEVIRHFLSINVEGMVLFAPTLEPDNPILEEVVSRGVGLVAVDARNALPVFSVDLDRVEAMGLILEHLHKLNHRQIGLLGFGNDDMYQEDRRKGLERAAGRLGLELNECLFIDVEGYSWRDFTLGEALAQKLLETESQLPTALVCLNDRLAIGVIKTLVEAGFRVPQDVSVVGFDNVPESCWTMPSLTTVDQNILKLMNCVDKFLWESIEGKGPRRALVEPELVTRESTGPSIRALANT